MIYTAAAENSASVLQEGANNGATIAQSGQGASAGIPQIGRNNTGALTQNGNNNAACLIQIGRNLDGSITQNGDDNNTGVIQTRRGATEIPAELCSPHGAAMAGASSWALRAREKAVLLLEKRLCYFGSALA